MSGSSRFIRRSFFERLETRSLLASDLFISEFQARNRETILDEDGDSSDWIEIGNRGDTAANLDGWFLTDDADDLTKWRLAESVVEPGEFLVVYASGKDRHGEGVPSHTNFRLSGSGEYLALVKPDGTVAQDFGERFPAMSGDQSFGMVYDRESAVVVDVDASIRALVPADDSLGRSWINPLFDDSDWIHGNGAVGYENPTLAYTLREDFSTAESSEWVLDVPDGSAATVEELEGQLRLTVPPRQNTTGAERGLAPMLLMDPPEDTAEFELIAHIVKDSSTNRGAVGLAIVDGTTGRARLLLEQTGRQTFAVTNGVIAYDSVSQRQDGSFHLRWTRDAVAKTWRASFRIQESDEWTQIVSLTEGDTTTAISSPKLAVYARTEARSFAGAIESVEILVPRQRPKYEQDIDLNLAEAMSNANSSVYLRFPFRLDDESVRYDSLELGVEFDDGFVAYLNGTEIASRNATEQRTWNAAAEAVHGAASGEPIEMTRIELVDAATLLRPGENLLAIHGMNVAADDSDFFMRALAKVSTRTSETGRYFSRPTPGAPNQRPVAPSPRLLTGGNEVFDGTTTVALDTTLATRSLAIHYTLDGTIPTRSSTVYTEPIRFDSTTVFHARTFDTLPIPDFAPSDVLGLTLIAIDDSLRMRQSELPIMIIDTMEQEINPVNSIDLTLTSIALFDVDEPTGHATVGSTHLDYIGRGGIRDRGSSTAGQPKPNLTFETWGASGVTRDDDADVSLLGLPPESDWVLHAPFVYDRSLMRNQLAYELSNQMGHWAPHTRFVEVYLNRDTSSVDRDDYVGVYVLVERIKRGEDRIDVASIQDSDLNAPEITGGYVWKIDPEDPDAPIFSAGGEGLNWVYPESPLSLTARDDQRATIEQQQWVQDYFEQFVATLNEPDINDPEGYTRYIDVDAWIDQHLLHTVMRNIDAFVRSTFLYKDRNGKLVYGPPWDFDRSSESTDGRDDEPESRFSSTSWFRRLDDDPGFRQRYTDRWAQWRQSVFSDENIELIVNGLADEVGAAANRNFARWPEVAPRSASRYVSYELDGTFEGEVRHLIAWLKDRTAFMDRQFSGPPRVKVDGRVVEPDSSINVFAGQSIEIESAAIEVFADTLILDGNADAIQARYHLPTDDDLSTLWTETQFDDADWSRGQFGLGFDDRDNFGPLVRTVVDPRINEGATTVLARVEFDVEDLTDLQDARLFLRMKYDDGFVAYLNGSEIARSNLPVGRIGWNSDADNRDNDSAVEFEDLDVSRFQQELLPGRNVLAIRLVNETPRSTDMLLVPQLVARKFSQSMNPEAMVYYTVDGTDPRGLDGDPATSALAAIAGTPIVPLRDTRLVVRNVDNTMRDGSTFDSPWSAPRQYDIFVQVAGDANRDGIFDSRDLQLVNRLNEYDDQIAGNSTWQDGDWNGDGEFDSEDLVFAFQFGLFEATAV